jgi:endonuclease/exonuclease/phosphatase family metal-dependent hydrolase
MAFLAGLVVGGAGPAPARQPTDTFALATYNLENYLDTATPSRPAKPEAGRSKIVEALQALRADVLALQEVGGRRALLELGARLRAAGLDYPHHEIVEGFDTNIQVALLSRFPIVDRRSHSNLTFLLHGRRFRTTRGILEVDLAVSPRYQLTLMAVHLKSRRESSEASQEDIREQEAQVLRRLIDARLRQNPDANLVVLGDLNDLKSSMAVRTIIGRGAQAMVDTRPSELQVGVDADRTSAADSRSIAWTHFYAREDTYSRVDYILVSRGLAREWHRSGTYVLAFPDWGQASDHRPLLARFHNSNR